MLKQQSDKIKTLVFDMNNQVYPFGKYNQLQSQPRNHPNTKVLIRKILTFKSFAERQEIREKLQILTHLSHKNVINIRYFMQKQYHFEIYYAYINQQLMECHQLFLSQQQTFKQFHKQLIQLTIHLAKNNIITSFNGKNCGLIFNNFEGSAALIKYYLSLDDIRISNERSQLERSVMLFKVQAMHLLDQLTQQIHCHQQHSMNQVDQKAEITHSKILSETSLGHRLKAQQRKHRVNSQCMLSNSANSELASNNELAADKALASNHKSTCNYKSQHLRKNSNSSSSDEHTIKFQQKKLSNLNNKIVLMNRKASNQTLTTNYSHMKLTNLKETMVNFRRKSEQKRSMSNEIRNRKQIIKVIRLRSERAIRMFTFIKCEIYTYKALSQLLKICSFHE